MGPLKGIGSVLGPEKTKTKHDLPKTLSNSSKLIFLVHNGGHHSDMDKHGFMVDEDVRSIQ